MNDIVKALEKHLPIYILLGYLGFVNFRESIGIFDIVAIVVLSVYASVRTYLNSKEVPDYRIEVNQMISEFKEEQLKKVIELEKEVKELKNQNLELNSKFTAATSIKAMSGGIRF